MKSIVRYACLLTLLSLLWGCATRSGSTDSGPELSPPPEPIETGMLEAVPGYVGDVLGAEVTETDTTGENVDIINVTVPVDPGQVEEVRVIAPSGTTIKQEKPAELEPDYQNQRMGITLFLPKRKNWVFKLRLVDLNADR